MKRGNTIVPIGFWKGETDAVRTNNEAAWGGEEENNEWTENIRSISRRITKWNKNGTKSKWKSWKERRSNVTRMKGWKGLDKLFFDFFFFFCEKSFGLNSWNKSLSSLFHYLPLSLFLFPQRRFVGFISEKQVSGW